MTEKERLRDKGHVKAQIRALVQQIRDAGPSSFEWAPLEWEIAELVIDYSIRHDIRIPLIDYDAYMRREAVQAALDKPREPGVLPGRWKLDDDASGPEEPYFYFDDFSEAIGEECLVNPRFKLHPDIRELVACWAPDPFGEGDSENTN